MNDEELKQKASRFAALAHIAQKDDNGENYFEAHLEKVAELLEVIGAPTSVVVAGYLHDTVEDTNVTYSELVAEFGKEVADLVMEVTHDGQKDEVGYYFPRLTSQGAILIKFADRLSNLSRMQGWTEQRQAHYLKHSKFWKSKPGEKL